MPHSHSIFAALGFAAISAPAFAQVGPGESVEFSTGPMANGIDIIDAGGSGALTAITGATPAAKQFNGGVIDPVTGDIWVSVYDVPGASTIHRFSVTGSAITKDVVVVTGVPGSSYFAAIDLDRDGNAFVCGSDGVSKIDRHTFAVTNWTAAGTIPGGNGITIDRETNTLWTVTLAGLGTPIGEIREFDLSVGPSLGTVIFDAVAAGMPRIAGGITHDGNGTLYVGCWDGLYGYNTNSGIATLVPTNAVMNPFWGINNEFNNIDYDSIHNTLHTAGGVVGDAAYHTVDPVSGASTLLNTDHYCQPDPGSGNFCFDADVMSGVSVNDYLHTTQVFPREASIGDGFKLEVAAQGMPGDFAAIAVVELNGNALANPLVLGSFGICGLGGNFVFTKDVPAGALPAFITSIGLDTVTYDFATGVFTTGGIETVLVNP